MSTARELALRIHAQHTYGGVHGYSYHLEACQEVFVRLRPSIGGWVRSDVEAALWLHDAVEMSPDEISLVEIRSLFGPVVAEAVDAVTDAPGDCRRARKFGTPEIPGPLVKLRGSSLGLLVKLVDRIANVEFGLTSPQGSMLKAYRKEQADLRVLRTLGVHDLLWDHLEEILAGQPKS